MIETKTKKLNHWVWQKKPDGLVGSFGLEKGTASGAVAVISGKGQGGTAARRMASATRMAARISGTSCTRRRSRPERGRGGERGD